MKRFFSVLLSSVFFPFILIVFEWAMGSRNLINLYSLYFLWGLLLFLFCGIPFSLLIDKVLMKRFVLQKREVYILIELLLYALAGALSVYMLLWTVSNGTFQDKNWIAEDYVSFIILILVGSVAANIYNLIHKSLTKLTRKQEIGGI